MFMHIYRPDLAGDLWEEWEESGGVLAGPSAGASHERRQDHHMAAQSDLAGDARRQEHHMSGAKSIKRRGERERVRGPIVMGCGAGEGTCAADAHMLSGRI